MMDSEAFLELGRWILYGAGLCFSSVWLLFALVPGFSSRVSFSFRGFWALSLSVLILNAVSFLRSVESLRTAFGAGLDALALLAGGSAALLYIAGWRNYHRRPRPLMIAGILAHAAAWLSGDLLALAVCLSGLAIWELGMTAYQKREPSPEPVLVAPVPRQPQMRQAWQQELTELRAHTEKLENEIAELRRQRKDFLTNINHELRTPLNSVIGYSELLRTGIYGALNEQQTNRLERIWRNAKYLSSLLNSILDLNRIEAGKFELDSSRFSLREIFDTVSLEYEPRIRQKGLDYLVDCGADVPDLVGDKDRVRQIVLNLVDNALKFTNSGKICVRGQRLRVKDGVGLEAELPARGWLKNGEWVLISVEDTGIGIAPELQQRIFEQFVQADNLGTREYEGIGLGLTIARTVAEKHSGSLWLKSRPGEGSIFFVALPAVTMIEGRKMSA